MFPALKNARQRAKVIKLPPRVRGLPTVPLEETTFELVPRDRFMNFNDYFDGPTLEEQRTFYADEGYDAAPIYPDHKPTFRGQGELFIDWGYRLLPEFAHMFASSKPQKVKEHLLPVWKKLGTEEADQEEEAGQDGEVVTDVKVMGMKEMLDAAEEYPGAGIDVFVRGRLRDGRYIKLDPMRDDPRVQHVENALGNPPFHIPMRMVCDIDSIIVTAHTLQVQDDVEVFVFPYIGKRPPLWKTNHTLLMCACCSPSPMKTRQKNPGKNGLRHGTLLLSSLIHISVY